MRFLRLLVALTMLVATLAACGGGSAQTTDDGAAGTPTTAGQSTGTTQGGSSGGGGTTGANSITYEISGGFEASGEEPFNASLSFFSEGVWVMNFGSASTVLLLALDPSTPSVNWTNGTTSAGADSSNCEFNITRQDASGASGSFSCSNVAVVNAGVLTEAASFTGTWDANA
jgi:hypothetical protein